MTLNGVMAIFFGNCSPRAVAFTTNYVKLVEASMVAIKFSLNNLVLGGD